MNLNLSFVKGINVVKGKSGIGKSTLLRILLGFENYDSGSINFDGLELHKNSIEEIRKSISWIPQNLSNTVNVPLKVLIDYLMIDFTKFEKSLKFFNMNFENKAIKSFSQGEQQRIYLSIARTQARKVLIADEPSSALDNYNKQSLVDYLKSHQGIVICTSHDQDIIEIADEIIDMESL